ncbi:hypothetical protein Csa_017415 [Cucumis sativus]|uniref:Uncharacterized protein n=1 Tax=Cucumis sativus TaxID=3659 RepID=A0A0A0LDT2_CUCSA|nr:hypothetical protein Csa_017415 [Cucumis sativus]
MARAVGEWRVSERVSEARLGKRVGVFICSRGAGAAPPMDVRTLICDWQVGKFGASFLCAKFCDSRFPVFDRLLLPRPFVPRRGDKAGPRSNLGTPPFEPLFHFFQLYI